MLRVLHEEQPLSQSEKPDASLEKRSTVSLPTFFGCRCASTLEIDNLQPLIDLASKLLFMKRKRICIQRRDCVEKHGSERSY
jgi:hypothetical protein